MYSGTTVTLNCDYNLSSLVYMQVEIAVTWMVNGEAVDTSLDQIITDSSMLRFSPLSITDTGSYICELTVTILSQMYVATEGPLQSAEVAIIVQGMNYIVKHIYYFKRRSHFQSGITLCIYIHTMTNFHL